MISRRHILSINTASKVYTPCKESAVAAICLNCPLPECKNPLTCKRCKDELKKLEVNNET